MPLPKKKIKDKDFEIKIKWSQLEAMASFYQFPVAVFLLSAKSFKGTRKQMTNKKIEAFNKIQEIIQNYDQEN